MLSVGPGTLCSKLGMKIKIRSWSAVTAVLDSLGSDLVNSSLR